MISAKRAIITNTTAQLFGKVINTGSSLLVTILIARNFGAQYYGDFTKAFVTATLFFIGIDFGLNAITVRRMQDSQDEQKEFKNAFGVRVVLAAVFFILLSLFVLIIPTVSENGYSTKVKMATLIFGLTFFEQASFTTANAIFQRRLKYAKSAVASSLGSLVILAAVMVVIAVNGDVRTVALAHLLGSITMMSVALAFARAEIGSISPRFNVKKMRGLISEAFPVGVALLINMLMIRVGTILLAFFRSSSEVGFYGLAFRAFDVVLVFPAFVMNSAYPIMVERVRHGSEQLVRIVKKVALLLFLASIAGLVVLFFASPLLERIRAEFIESQIPLKILSFWIPIFFLSSLMQWTLVSLKKEKLLIPIYLLALVINLIANLVMIPKFGMLAAALNTGISEFIVLFITSAVVLQSFRDTKELKR